MAGLNKAQLLMGDGDVLAGLVQGVKAGNGVSISPSGILSTKVPQTTPSPDVSVGEGSTYWDNEVGALFILYNNGGNPTWVQT